MYFVQAVISARLLHRRVLLSKRRQDPVNSPMQMIIPGIPLCRNCDLCLRNSWCPRAACNACLFGDCEEDPPIT